MIKSMTGYGSAGGLAGELAITVELKSVNNRYLDVSVRMPRSFLFAEDAVKGAVGRKLSRGKVDVFVSVDSSAAGDIAVKINEPLARGYVEAIHKIAEMFDVSCDLTASAVGRWPEVLSVEKKEQDADALRDAICEITSNALSDLDKMREREGEKLREDVLNKLTHIESLVSDIEREAPKTVEAYRRRLRQKLDEVLSGAGVDEQRILQEAAIYADRVAVDEETVRLRSHIGQLKAMLSSGGAIGRKLDFLIQEFNREANTIGSKCQNSELAHTVVELKADIEKIREQIQNIE